jgi:formylglycine-generating enzyme required for sulfatase activity
VSEGLVYVVLEEGVKVFSVSGLKNASVAGEYNKSGVQSIQVKGSIAYLGCRQGTVEIVDFSKPEQPSLKSVFYGGSPVYLVDIIGDKIIAVGCKGGSFSSSLYLIDVNNPVAPREEFLLDVGLFIDLENGLLCVSGNRVFVGGLGDLNGGKAVQQIKVNNGIELVVEKVFRYGSSTWYGSTLNNGLQVVGNLMYSAHKDGVMVDDLRPPDYGDFFRLKTRGNPTDLKVVDNLIYVADGNEGLQIIFSPSPPILSYPEFIKSDRVRLSVQGEMSSKVFIESSVDLRNWVVESYQTPLEAPEILLTTQGDTHYFRASKVPPGFVWIQPGSFMMGSPPGEQERGQDELQHEVTLTRGFWMAEHEVTITEYASVVRSNQTSDDRPIYVTWDEAVNYCKELTKRHRNEAKITSGQAYRLPTEAEWEYAARAGTTGPRYAETNRFGGRWRDVPEWTLRSVTRGSANPWGLYDMLSNAGEWCSDWYSEYIAGSQTDPFGPDSGKIRVIRGTGDGYWSFDDGLPRTFRSAERSVDIGDGAGFRIVLSSER